MHIKCHQTKPAFHLHGNNSLNKNVNVFKCSLFWEISTFLFFPPGESLAWPNKEFLKYIPNVLYFCSAFWEKGMGMAELAELWFNQNANFLFGAASHRDHLGISVQDRNIKKTFIKFLASLAHLQLWEGMTRCPKMLRCSVYVPVLLPWPWRPEMGGIHRSHTEALQGYWVSSELKIKWAPQGNVLCFNQPAYL